VPFSKSEQASPAEFSLLYGLFTHSLNPPALLKWRALIVTSY